MSEKHKKVCRSLNYFGHFFTFLSAISGYFSISAFVSWVGVFLGISSSAVVLKTWKLIAGIKKHKSIIKKKKHDEKVSLKNTKLNTTEVLTYKALINFCIKVAARHIWYFGI